MTTKPNQKIKEYLNYHQKQFDQEPLTIHTEEHLKRKTFSVVLRLKSDLQTEVAQYLTQVIGSKWEEYLTRQPEDGFHITLQWTLENNVSPEKLPALTEEIAEFFSQIKPLKGSLTFPYPSKQTLFAAFFTDEREIRTIRTGLSDIWYEYDLPLGIKEDKSDWFWISLIRYRKTIPTEEKQIIRSLPLKEINNVVFPTVEIVLTNPFLESDKTTLIKEITL